MKFKDDWSKAKERLTAFWENELIDRCCLSVVAPRDGAVYEEPVLPESMEDKIKWWSDMDVRVKLARTHIEKTYYGGEAFPQAFTYFGAAGHAGFFKGANFGIGDIKDSGHGNLWFFPRLQDRSTKPLEFDPDALLFTKTIELAKALVEDSGGDYFVSQPDISGNVDALAHLRGSDTVLMDMMTEKEAVHTDLEKIQAAWLLASERVYQITRENNEGGQTIGWMNTWARGRHAQLQSDISVMISPDLFDEFVLPELKEQSAWMDRALYHFDGADQTKHLDKLLSIDTLHAIQWTNVEGQREPMYFIDTLKKIQSAGKGLLMLVKPEWIEPLMKELSSKGLYLVTAAPTEELANDMIKMVSKLTRE